MSLPKIYIFHPCVTFHFGPKYHSQHPIMSLPTIYSTSSCVSCPIWPQISLSAPYYEAPQNIQFFTPLLPSPFGPRYHYQHPIIILPTICTSSPLCYLPHLAPDITLNTLLSASPQYTVLHSCLTFPFWPQISLSAPYYESPNNIQFYIPLLPTSFGPRYHSQHNIISLATIYSSSPLCYLPPLAPDITLSTLLSVSPQYTFLHSCVTSHFWPEISLPAPYYESPHNIQFFTPLLPSPFGSRYHSLHPIIRLPTINSPSFLVTSLFDPDITLRNQL